MAVLKCPVCGGDISISNLERSIYECNYCGSMITIPRDIEKKENLFNRATSLRQKKRYNNAQAVYEALLNEDDNNAEAHWGIVLCRYGVEYVKDSAGEYIPTCGRFSSQSILSDFNYLRTLELADTDAAAIYKKEAAKINEILKKINDISSKEKPYDIFICYKETDDVSMQRTPDSLKARELYDILEHKGYRVFFAKKSLNNFGVSEYEPYIYAALHSAKIMLLITSKREYADSPWVRNEWGRFLDIIKQEPEKKLLPLYFGMSPYDLPEELSVFQAYDMTKIGFAEELCDGMEKTLRKEETTPLQKIQAAAMQVRQENADIEIQLKRAYRLLEDEELDNAAIYFNKALNINPEESRAYWGLLLVSRQCTNDQDLTDSVPIQKDKNFLNACRFATPEQKDAYINISNKVNWNVYLKGLKAAKDGNVRIAGNWLHHYAENALAGRPEAAVLDTVVQSRGFREFLPEVPGALLKHMDLLADGKWREEAKAEYFSYINNLWTLFFQKQTPVYLTQENYDDCVNTLKNYVENYGKSHVTEALPSDEPFFKDKLYYTQRLVDYHKNLRRYNYILGDPSSGALANIEQYGGKSFEDALRLFKTHCISIDDKEKNASENQAILDCLTDPQHAFEKKYGISYSERALQEIGGNKSAAMKYFETVQKLTSDFSNLRPSEEKCVVRLYQAALSAATPEEKSHMDEVFDAYLYVLADKIWNPDVKQVWPYIRSDNNHSEKLNLLESFMDKDKLRDLLDKPLMQGTILPNALELIRKYRSDDYRVYWYEVKRTTNQFTFVQSPQIEKIQEDSSTYSHNGSRSYQTKLYEAQRAHRENIEKKTMNDFDLTCKYAGEKRDSIEAQYNEYRDKLIATENAYKIKADEEHAENLAFHRVKDRKMKIKGIIFSVLSLLFGVLSSIMVKYAYNVLQNPRIILKYHYIWFYVITIGASLLGGYILFYITSKFIQKSNIKYSFFLPCRIITRIVPFLCAAMALATIGLLVCSAVTYKGKIGTLQVSDINTLGYIKNHPDLSYVLTGDINIEGSEWKSVGTFSGQLDGQGHTISGLPLDKCFVEENKGEIKNINFSDFKTHEKYDYSFNGIAKTNYDSIENCHISGITAEFVKFSGIAYENHGTISRCTASNISVKTSDYCGIIAYENSGTITSCDVRAVCESVSGVGGIAYSSTGLIEISQFTGSLSGNLVGGIVCYNGGSVSECRTSGAMTASGSRTVACSAGIVCTYKIKNDAYISKCSSDCEVTATGENSVAGGVIGKFDYSTKYDGGKANISNCFYTGKITAEGRECCAGGLVGKISGYGDDKSLHDSIYIHRCYSSGKVTAHAESGGVYAYAGGLVAYFYCRDRKAFGDSSVAATLDSCFSAAEVADEFAGSYTYEAGGVLLSIKIINCYDINEKSLSYNTFTADSSIGIKITKQTTKAVMKSASFIRDTLGWDDSVWNIVDGKLPTLKPVSD